MIVGIVGLGLIGTSVALAVRRAQPDAQLIGVDQADIVRHSRILETFTAASTELAPVAAADLVVLAAPVDAILETLPRLATTCSPQTPILDTGSTKRRIVAAARDAGLSNFVGGHPMAGGAAQGPDEARAGLFDGRPWFLVPAGVDSTAVQEAQRFVVKLGAVPVVMPDDGSEHDRLMAAVSHLPQVVASALMALIGEQVGEEGLRLAGAGLRDTTRLASSSADVWASVFRTNADEMRPLLFALSNALADLALHVDNDEAVEQLFAKARRWRSTLSS